MESLEQSKITDLVENPKDQSAETVEKWFDSNENAAVAEFQ
jgi:hypothetical protein